MNMKTSPHIPTEDATEMYMYSIARGLFFSHSALSSNNKSLDIRPMGIGHFEDYLLSFYLEYRHIESMFFPKGQA